VDCPVFKQEGKVLVEDRIKLLEKFFQLSSFIDTLESIVAACDQLGIPGVFNENVWQSHAKTDPALLQIREIVTSLTKERQKLTAGSAKQIYNQLLGIFETLDNTRFSIFTTLLKAEQTVNFLREKKLISLHGRGNADFDSIRQQVTANMKNLKHETLVLNHFIGAQAYCSVVLGYPTFAEVIEGLKKLESLKYDCLETTEQNFSMIKLWVKLIMF
jgi:hypothetical protein